LALIKDEHKCKSCDGVGHYPLRIIGRNCECSDCHGDGLERVVITRKEYDSLLEYKSMYEGLNK